MKDFHYQHTFGQQKGAAFVPVTLDIKGTYTDSSTFEYTEILKDGVNILDVFNMVESYSTDGFDFIHLMTSGHIMWLMYDEPADKTTDLAQTDHKNAA